MADVKTVIKAAAAAFERQSQWKSLWQDISDFMLPARASFTATPSPATDRSRRVIDSTAEEALEYLAAGLHGMLTSRSQRWFYLAPEDPKLAQNYNVAGWLDAVMREMYSVFNAPHSQFHSQIDQCYMDSGGLGTCVLYSQESKRGGVSFQTLFLGDCAIEENSDGIVDTMYRQKPWRCDQIVEMWGENALPDQIKEKYKAGKECPPLMVLHAVVPRRNRVYDAIRNTSFPWASMWILKDYSIALDESGYQEFPYHVWRWRVRTGEQYGSGPGARLLADVKMLQEMTRTVLKAAQKAVDPPLMIPEGYQGFIRTVPGGLNFYDPNSPGEIKPIETRARVDIGIDMIQAKQQQIRQGFLRDAFDITADSDGTNVKATFTLARRDDKFRALSPVFSRADAELLEPVVMRVYNVLARQGRFPPPPAELEGKSLVVQYISPVARAMRTAEADDINRLLEMAAAMGAVNPEVYDGIDMDATLRIAGDQLFNVPHGVLRSPDQVKANREARQQQQSEQAAIAAIPEGAAALKDVASARKDFASA